MNPLWNIDTTTWDGPWSQDLAQRATGALESGQVLYFPRLTFALLPREQVFLDPGCSDGQAKNISLDPVRGDLKGTKLVGSGREELQEMIQRFANSARLLVMGILPTYSANVRWGRTSFRPVEVKERPASRRQDDSRLHVDAFPSRPNGGERILRVFCNINPVGQARQWRLGEPFEQCARRFLPKLAPPWIGSRRILSALGLTRGYRSLYDHYMLALHNAMKEDDSYQCYCPQYEVPFAAQATWVVFTDQVSHAAMTGQYLLEQTFHIPVAGQLDPSTAPLTILERLVGKPLVASTSVSESKGYGVTSRLS